MRSALHVTNSIDPKNGGTSVSVPRLMLATAETGRYLNTLIQFSRHTTDELIGPKTALSNLNNSKMRVPLNILLGGELSNAIRNADVVHVHGLWQSHCITSGILGRRFCKPVIISAHGMLERWAIRNKAWKKWPYSCLFERPNLRRATVLRALTTAEVDDYRRFGLLNPIALISNGTEVTDKVSPDLFLSHRPGLRGRRLLLYLSRIHYKKGVDLLVNAWSQIASQFPDAHLVIAGPDFEATQPIVERLVKELSIEDRVTFTGPVYGDLKASLLSAASVFVLPSHSEGFSMAVLESLAAGVPVIITNQCNFPAVSTTCSGWVISPTTVEIKCALQEALGSSTSALQHRGRRGLELVRDHYSWSHIGKQMAEVYDWMLGDQRPGLVEIVE